jgi:hypothetical protein
MGRTNGAIVISKIHSARLLSRPLAHFNCHIKNMQHNEIQSRNIKMLQKGASQLFVTLIFYEDINYSSQSN